MIAETLIAAVRSKDRETARTLLGEGADPNQAGEFGWTALCWAAACGDTELVSALLDRGADVFLTGTDQRTPYLIALAAGHAEAARLLQQAEESQGGDRERVSSRQDELRSYCAAYHLGQLRQFQGWKEETLSNTGEAMHDESIVFLHRDFSVTLSIWQGEQVVFNHVTEEWRQFCESTLRFRVPTDFDLLPPAPTREML